MYTFLVLYCFGEENITLFYSHKYVVYSHFVHKYKGKETENTNTDVLAGEIQL